VTVICGPYRTAPDDARSITNPTVLIEVLSPSTEAYDKRAKFEHYRHIESLLDVVCFAPEQEAVVHLARTEGGWLRRDLTEGEVHFTGLPGISLAFADIYADLDNVPVTAEAKRPTAPDGNPANPDANPDASR
jgi:Uma2 family endonuclease